MTVVPVKVSLALLFFCRCSRTLHIDFRSESASGLIFVVGDFKTADMASAYLRDGHLTFARRCGSGRAFEVHHHRFDDQKWHTVSEKSPLKGHSETDSLE